MSDLLDGDLVIEGRIMPASNHTYAARVGSTQVVYKPSAGERPLWDFPDGNLAQRELAAYVVSESLGWAIVPETVLRDGPAGPGMVQRWGDPDGPPVVDVVAAGAIAFGWRHVVDGEGARGEPVSLVHEDSEGLRRMALFDLITNNTDRKGGHILSMADGRRLGVDHGICFHTDDKVRTVLWGWAGSALSDQEHEHLLRLRRSLEARVGETLATLLTPAEVAATTRRLDRLLEQLRFPLPSHDWPAIPWPPF